MLDVRGIDSDIDISRFTFETDRFYFFSFIKKNTAVIIIIKINNVRKTMGY